MNHLEELAELYALGSLTAEEEVRLNAHIATCEECRKRVNDAEKVVARVATEQAKSRMPGRPVAISRRPSPVWRYAIGFAAGLILPLLLLVPPALRARYNAQESHVAFSALVNSHFSHVAFVRRTADAPRAKLLYERTGAWLLVVALNSKSDLAVLLRSGHTVRAAGTIHANLPDAEVFVPEPGAVSEVLLARGGVVVGDARPVFTSQSPGNGAPR